MKHLSYTISVIISLIIVTSCKSSETPESVANQSLEIISKELKDLGFCSYEHFNMTLVNNAQAEAFISGNEIPDSRTLIDKYFQFKEPFYRWEFDSIQEQKTDIYRITDFTYDKGGEYEGLLYKEYLNLYGKEGGEFEGKKLCKINETAAAILEYRDVPIYFVKYRIDSHHVDFVGTEYKLATIGVIKHPENGYIVVSFTIGSTK